MTAREVIVNANRSNVANGDFDLNACLFNEIIPKFMDRVGNVSWSRKIATITTEAGTRNYDLPDDFWRMIVIGPTFNPDDAITKDGLEYYGEDLSKVLLFESSTEQRKPTGYMLAQNDDGELKRLRFDATPDGEYVFPYVYQWQLDPKNTGVEVDLNANIPARFQWALVSGLRAEIMLDRFDQDDRRYIAEKDKFDEACARAASTSNREQGRRGRYGVFASG